MFGMQESLFSWFIEKHFSLKIFGVSGWLSNSYRLKTNIIARSTYEEDIIFFLIEIFLFIWNIILISISARLQLFLHIRMLIMMKNHKITEISEDEPRRWKILYIIFLQNSPRLLISTLKKVSISHSSSSTYNNTCTHTKNSSK